MKIKIGHRKVAVETFPALEAEEDGAVGIWEPTFSRIRIRADLPPEEQARVLLHELIHGCFSVYSIPDTELTEEAVCEGLDGPLAAIFADNPELLGVLHQALSNGRSIVKA